MTTGKVLLTFVSGMAAAFAAIYLADPEGSEKKYDSLKEELKKTGKSLGENLNGKLKAYKSVYNDLVDKYAQKSKEAIEKTRSSMKTDNGRH